MKITIIIYLVMKLSQIGKLLIIVIVTLTIIRINSISLILDWY